MMRAQVMFEEWLTPILDAMVVEQREQGVVWTPSKMIHRMGREIDNPESVYYWCYKNDIPVYSPAITDGSIGDMIFFHSFKTPGLVLDLVQVACPALPLVSLLNGFVCYPIFDPLLCAGHQGHQRYGHACEAQWCSHTWRRRGEAPHHERQSHAQWHGPLCIHQHRARGCYQTIVANSHSCF
jgi:hypothetical protein